MLILFVCIPCHGAVDNNKQTNRHNNKCRPSKVRLDVITASAIFGTVTS